jgi:hypothetical protein
MGSQKKRVRAAFRTAVFERDRYRCVMCGKPGKDRQGGDGHKKHHKNIPEDKLVPLDAHHITDRNDLPNGGYVKENGATLCGSETDGCHALAEVYHQTGEVHPGYSLDDLYARIRSSREEAERASLKLA